MRILAFLAGIAGLVSFTAQAGTILILVKFNQLSQYVPVVRLVASIGQLSFILLITIFFLVFALRKRAV